VEIADDDVLPHGEVREEIQLLVDDADAEALRVERAFDADRIAVQRDDAGVGRGGAGQNTRQGALTRAVLADQRMYLAGTQIEVRAPQRVDAAVMFADALSL
jgi:hypothetical protein